MELVKVSFGGPHKTIQGRPHVLFCNQEVQTGGFDKRVNHRWESKSRLRKSNNDPVLCRTNVGHRCSVLNASCATHVHIVVILRDEQMASTKRQCTVFV